MITSRSRSRTVPAEPGPQMDLGLRRPQHHAEWRRQSGGRVRSSWS